MHNLLTARETYKPFHYPQAYEFWLQQQQAHWLATEVAMSSDIADWNHNLSDTEKRVIGGILKGFIQMEIHVNEYWSQCIGAWFKHPEIGMMASTFAGFESIHTHAYAHLNETLGIEDYDAFLAEPTAKAKIDRLVLPGIESRNEYTRDERAQIAKSIAVFSAFAEGVSLFSSFAVLLNFSRFNKLRGVGQIISWSVRDETLHSRAGCWLFRQFVAENPSIWTDEDRKVIYQAARDAVALEDAFIDMVFAEGEVEGLDPRDLKSFIRHRANIKLGELGLKQNWKNIDADALKRMDWFDSMVAGTRLADFFSTKPTDYSRATMNFDNMFDEE